MQDALLNLAKELISRPSITPDDSGCQAILKTYLQAAGFKCETLTFEGVENLWAKYGQNAPLIVFAGHTDVVPPGPLSDWETPPFDPHIKDGYLYGRGTSDMKCAIAAMVIAATTFLKSQPSFTGSIGFLITSDEEGPSVNGTKKVIETLNLRQEKIDYCIVGEPSSEKTVGDRIRIGRRGSLHGKLMVHGKQGHVANPTNAANPIHLSLQTLDELSKTTWDTGNADFPPTTFQITNLHAGTGALNVIPGHLELAFNFRFGTASTTEKLMAQVKAKLEELKLSYHLDWTIGAEPFLSAKSRLLVVAAEAIANVTNQQTTYSTGGGTSDARFIVPTGAETIELGLSNATAHQVNERVAVEDLFSLAKIYTQILKNLQP